MVPFTIRLLTKWWHSLAYCDFTAYAATSHPVVSSWALTSFVRVCSALQIFYVFDMSNFPFKCMVKIIYLWTSVDVYDFTHLLLESYCSLRNCIVPSVVGILAATVLELDQTLMPIISKHNNHFLMSVFTNRIDIEIYLECGISQCASA